MRRKFFIKPLKDKFLKDSVDVDMNKDTSFFIKFTFTNGSSIKMLVAVNTEQDKSSYCLVQFYHITFILDTVKLPKC